MWTRLQLKTNAKEKLRRYYWRGFVVTLIIALLNGNGGIPSGGFSYKFDQNAAIDRGFEYSNQISPVFIAVALFIFLLVLIFTLAFAIFFINPLLVGAKRFFLLSGERRVEISEILFAFKKGIYLNIVKIMFLQNLYRFLWSLLFVIPGIIKTYEYLMIPYLLAENPNMSSADAFEISREMMTGEKWDAFVLELSFLGWIFLGILTCGLGVFFVNPYIEATFAEFFLAMKAKLYYRGDSRESEFRAEDNNFTY